MSKRTRPTTDWQPRAAAQEALKIGVITISGLEEKQPAYEVSLILGGVATPNTKRFETLFGSDEFENEPHDGLLG